MKTIYNLLFLSAIFFSLNACSEEAKICDRFEGWTIITEADRGTTCEYQSVYLYNGSYYSTYSCCVCDVIPMAFDCNNQPLCEFDENCMNRFNRRAEYLFSALEN